MVNMRQRRWLEQVKDYDIEILVVAEALSRKVVHTSAMITKQERIQDEMKRARINVVIRGGTTLDNTYDHATHPAKMNY